MSKAWIVDGEVWKLIEPVLPPWPQNAPGPVPDRQCLQGILLVLHTGDRVGRPAARTPSPVNRGKPGSEHHLICNGNGTPIYVLTSGVNVPGISRALYLLNCYLPSPVGPVGHDAGSMSCSPTRDTTATPSGRHAGTAAPNR